MTVSGFLLRGGSELRSWDKLLPTVIDPDPSLILETPVLHIVGRTDVVVPRERSNIFIAFSRHKRVEEHIGGAFQQSAASFMCEIHPPVQVTSYRQNDGGASSLLNSSATLLGRSSLLRLLAKRNHCVHYHLAITASAKLFACQNLDMSRNRSCWTWFGRSTSKQDEPPSCPTAFMI